MNDLACANCGKAIALHDTREAWACLADLSIKHREVLEKIPT